ncbi:MAG: response regulator transcription factor [Deltaproteobacteria bacterium]|jgi:DNA-binding response OmpR family regulator|nr:response regulator transcription factor [Deltaproteobacteria bacterium]
MNENQEARILLVDDAVRLRSRVEDFLESHNFAVKSLADGRGAKEAISEFMADLMLLDVMMPGQDGFDVLRSVRESSAIPIIMLTACNNRGDRVKGLDYGADDYLGKPFHLSELLARIRAVLRRSLPKSSSEITPGTIHEELISGPLRLDIGKRRLTLTRNGSGTKKDLTNLEFRLFYLFISRAGQVLSRDEILDELFESRVSVDGHSLRVYINRIRKILSELGLDPRTVSTVWGAGYRWVSDASKTEALA